MPTAVKSLAAHLGDGDPVAWRAALRVFELSYGKPAESVELDLDVVDPLHLAEMTSAERALLVARVLEVHPHLAELVPLHLRAMEQAGEGHPLEAEKWRRTPRPVLGVSWVQAVENSSTTPTSSRQNRSTVRILIRSSGEWGASICGPNEIMSRAPGTRSPITAVSSQA